MSKTLPDCYRCVEGESASMVEAAQQQDWEKVRHCEERCAALIERLQRCAQSTPLAPDEQHEKAQIMQRILRNDAEVRSLAEPSLKRYESLFDASALRVSED